jgi:predicted dehydrogenase
MGRALKVGLIGLGYIGKIHAIAYRDIRACFESPKATAELTAVLRSGHAAGGEAQGESGFGLVTQDSDVFFAQPLDLVDICTPNFLHREQVEQALDRGLPVYCEKPLANTLGEARAMADLAARADVLTQVAFVLRYLPGIRQMKALIAAGQIGEVLNCRAQMFHSSYLDPERPMSWRLRRRDSGGGALADLGSHLIDLFRYLVGEIQWVCSEMRTFIPERPEQRGSSRRQPVDVDDWAHCVVGLENGAVGTIEVTRMAAGAGEATSVEVFGRKGALVFHISEPETVRYHDLQRGQWLQGKVEAPAIPGERPVAGLWPPAKYSQGTMVNAHLAAAYDFLQCVSEGAPSAVDFAAGLAAQEVLEAAYRSAAHNGERVALQS